MDGRYWWKKKMDGGKIVYIADSRVEAGVMHRVSSIVVRAAAPSQDILETLEL